MGKHLRGKNKGKDREKIALVTTVKQGAVIHSRKVGF
jgi:hypothetical protein